MYFTHQRLFLLTLGILFTTALAAQKDSFASQNKYYSNLDTKWLLEIPLWVPGFRGKLSYGDVELNTSTPKEKEELERIQKDPGLEFYFVGRASYKTNRFWFQADAFSGTVGNTFTFTPKHGTKERELVYVAAQGTMPRLIVGYSIWKKTFNTHSNIEILPYTGIRYIYIEFEGELITGEKAIDVVSSWFEPLIGVSIPYNYKRLRLELQGDWGGTANKNSVMVNSYLKYRISRLVETKLGWTSIYSRHKGIVKDQVLGFNINLQGPTLGVGFNF